MPTGMRALLGLCFPRFFGFRLDATADLVRKAEFTVNKIT